VKTSLLLPRSVSTFGVVLLLVVVAGYGCKKDASTDGGTGSGSGSSDYPSGCPKFDSTSSEPVLLRYKCRPDQKVKFGLDMDTNMDIGAPDGKVTVETAIKMEGGYEVTAVESNGDFQAVMTITRATMNMNMSAGPGKSQRMSFDSDKDAGGDVNPAMRPLLAMLKVPIPVKVSAVGKLLETDMHPLLEALDRAHAGAMAKELQQQATKLFESTFVQLSESPVKAGDTYDAGNLVQAVPGLGEMRARIRYKVLAVSGDKKQAVLLPKAEFSLESKPGASEKIKMESTAIDGWLLFDVEKGNIQRSAADVKMGMIINAGGQSGRMDMTMKMKFHTSE